MQKIIQNQRLAGVGLPHINIQHSIARGLIAGLAATLVMDFLLVGLLAAAGLAPLTCFSIVGETLARLFSITGLGVESIVLLGMAAHYMIGPAFGALFGAATQRFRVFGLSSLKKVVVSAVIFAEVLSQPILALPPFF